MDFKHPPGTHIQLSNKFDKKRWLYLKRFSDFGHIGNKGCQIWAENLNFPLFSVDNLFKFSAQGQDLATFVGNVSTVEKPSEIKPPLASIRGKKWQNPPSRGKSSRKIKKISSYKRSIILQYNIKKTYRMHYCFVQGSLQT